MTTLIGWVGVDSRRVTSVYLASDSRFTWTDRTRWDYGKKLFATHAGTELLGYCGDVLFTSQVLGQVVDQIDAGVFAPLGNSPDARTDKLIEALQAAVASYPASQRRNFDVAYVGRQSENMNASFYIAVVSWRNNVLTKKVIDHPSQSSIVLALGSGATMFNQRLRRLTESESNERTSRLMYTAFCDHLMSGEDRNTGGPPQLVGLFSSQGAHVFGIIHRGDRWMSGLKVKGNPAWNKDVPWRDDLFQVCDGSTMALAVGAQRQPKTYA